MSIRWASVLLPVCIARAKNECNSSQNRKRDTCVHSFSFSVGFCSLGNRANGSTCAKLSSVRMHTQTHNTSPATTGLEVVVSRAILLARIFWFGAIEAPQVHTVIKDFLFGGLGIPWCCAWGMWVVRV